MAEFDPTARRWYIAYVQSCKERKVAESLGRLGFECYLPVQKELRQWSDRKKLVDRLVLPRLIFVRCMEHERIGIRQDVPYLVGFMAVKGPYTAAVVRDEEMDVFRRMVEGGRPVSVSAVPLQPGDKVRVVDGPLRGMACELVEVSGRRCLGVSLGALGMATVDLALDSVEKLQ